MKKTFILVLLAIFQAACFAATPEAAETSAFSPELKIYFNSRLYQEGEKAFYTTPSPRIILQLEVPAESEVSFAPALIDQDKTASVKKSAKVARTSSAGDSQIIEAILELLEDLEEGIHTFEITVRYGDPAEPSEITRIATVNVQGGPLRIVDFPLVYPSPFSVSRNREMVIQYTLSDNADVDLYIYSSSGEIVKRFSFASGQEGGLADLNQVKWNGRSDVGSVIGNGIYLGIITSKKQNKILGNFKLTAYN